MRKYFALSVISFLTILLYAQDRINIYFNAQNAKEMINIDEIGTVTFKNGVMNIGGTGKTFNVTDIEYADFTLEGASEAGDTIFVTFKGDAVEVSEYKWENISYTTNGAYVNFTSAQNVKGIVYYLSGEAEDGQFQITPDRGYTLVMDNLKLKSESAPIVINAGADDTYSTSVELVGESTIADGQASNYKGSLYAKSKLKFCENGSKGTLNISGNTKHAINSSKKTEVYGGVVNVKSAVSDGLNSDGLQMYGGEFNISGTGGDGVDASKEITIDGGRFTFISSSDDAKAMKCDSAINILKGEVEITMTGLCAKGMKSTLKAVTISGGKVGMDINSAPMIADGDTSYAAGIKSDSDVNISGGEVRITMGTDGTAAKGITSDKNVSISGGTIAITNNGGYYTGATTTTTSSGGMGGWDPGSSSSKTTTAYTEGRCVKADQNIVVTGGNITCTTSNGAKGIKAEGTITIGEANAENTAIELSITTRCNEKQSSSSSSSSTGRPGGFGGPGGGMSDGNSNKYAGAPKGMVAGEIEINSGNITIDAYDDAIHSNGNLTINGGRLTIDATDDGIHSDSDLTMNNGYVRVKTAYEGLEGANIYANDGTTYVTTTDDCWNVTTDNTGMLRVSGGYHYAMSSAGDHDAMDSNGSFEMSGGVLVTCGSSPMDAGDGSSCYQKHTGGAMLVLNNSQGNDMWSQDVKPTCANSIQNTSCSVASGKILCVADSDGNIIAALKTQASHSKVLFAYGSSLSGYSFYTASDESGIEFELFDGLYAEKGEVSSGSLSALGTSSSGNTNPWGGR